MPYYLMAEMGLHCLPVQKLDARIIGAKTYHLCFCFFVNYVNECSTTYCYFVKKKNSGLAHALSFHCFNASAVLAIRTDLA